jgi:hypothetical protein
MPDPNNDNYSIVPHTSRPQVLLLREDTGWILPRHQVTMPEEINIAMQAQLGLTTTVLFCAYDRYQDDEREEQHRVYALENHSPGVSPPANGRWIVQAELANLPLAVPEHRSVLEAWFAGVEGGKISEQRLSWMRPGWFASATAWIHEQLVRLGYTQVAPITQVTARPWSAVLRVPTTASNLYFKVPAPAFAFEIALTETLAQLVPASIPHLLASDRQQHWMLMKDGGITLRSGLRDPARLEEALRQFAQMQIQLAAHIETLKATGCPDRRLHVLPRLYQELLAATPFLLIDEPKGLPRSEYEQLLAYVPQLNELCEELASFNVPESLGHDDLHTNNILYNGAMYVFIDLAECLLTHPFCALFIALRSAKYRLGYDDEQLKRLRQAYLAPWTRYEPMERLQRAFSLAHRLGSLYKALSWYRVISQLEPGMRWMFKDSALYYLRVFLGTEE